MNGYQLRIDVEGCADPIWRRIKIPAIISFEDLHQLIQTLFGFEDYHLYEFRIKELGIWIPGGETDIENQINDDVEIVDNLERIADYLKKEMVIYYHYDFGDDWQLLITVEQELEGVEHYPVVVEFCGNNLIEDCGGIERYQEIILSRDDLDINFDLEDINSCLSLLGVDEILNNSPLKNEFIEILEQLKELVKKREFTDNQVIKLVSNQTTYWVILKTLEGYVIELFETYNDLLEGFYNLANEGINNAFCNCWTILLSEQELDFDVALDEDNYLAAFRNEAGYIPCLLEVEEARVILELLKEFANGIKEDQNRSESDEIIEIYVEDGKFKESAIFVHEPQIDLNRYDFGYLGEHELETKRENTERLCVDVVCLPMTNTDKTNELNVYAVIAGESDYLIKEVDFPSLQIIGEALIDGLLEYANRYGKPQRIVVNNLNVLFLVLNFISQYDIDYFEDEITLEIEGAIMDAFGLETADEAFNDHFIQELLEQLDGKSEEEIEEKINEILANMELLN